VAASIIGARTLVLGQARGHQLGGGPTTTQTVRGVSVTYPAGWHFENVAALASGTGLFIVANYSPGAPFVDLPDNEVCTPTAAVLAVQETYQVAPGGRPAHAWPTKLEPAQPTIQGCRGTETAYWTTAGRSFEATALYGREVPAQDRSTLHAIFSIMKFAPAPSGQKPVPVRSPSGTIIVEGTDAGTHWVVSANENGGSLSLQVDLPGQAIGVGVPRGPGGQVPILSPGSVPLGAGTGGKLLVFGFVSHGVSSAHIEPTHEIAKLYPFPGHRELMVFVVVADRSPNAMVVAEDEGGKVLAREPVNPPTPHPRASLVTHGPPKFSPSP
jgi:hypothetical protein